MRTNVLNVITTHDRDADKRTELRKMTGTSWEMNISSDRGTVRYTSVHEPFIFHVERIPEGSYTRDEDDLEWRSEIRTVLGPLPGLTKYGSVGSDPVKVFGRVWEVFRETIPPGLTRKREVPSDLTNAGSDG